MYVIRYAYTYIYSTIIHLYISYIYTNIYTHIYIDGQTVEEVSQLLVNLVIKQQSTNILLTEIPFNIGSNYQR